MRLVEPRAHPDAEREAERVRRVNRAYGEDARKQRAWAETNPGNRCMRQEVLEVALRAAAEPLRRDLPLLDIGCGTGGYLAAIAERVPEARLHGVDLVEARLSEARRRVPGADLHLTDGRRLPYEDGTFGVSLLFTVLSSITPAAAGDVVDEARRVLAPGGVLLVYDMRLPSPNPNVRRIGRRELRRLLGPDACLVSLTVLPPLARRLGPQTARIYPGLARVAPLRTHWLASATR